MSLTPGTRLGSYEIVAPLGAGGMGEVYRARDTRLDRTVAIKVLSAGMAWSDDARARFEREAKTISQLSHPHICALFDVGREGDTEFLVLEYLEGETLGARIARGPLLIEQAVTVAAQIADALDTAHRRGVIHRDLKPGNVILVRTGSSRTDGPAAKLLDFGLAKAMAAPQPTIATALATVTSPAPLTGQGMVLGTMPYMAPEQVEGEEADARSDLWALGCVLYEMLTGRRAFDGKTQTNVAAAILEREAPSVTALAPSVSPAIAHVVGRCLEKDRDARWQTASDVRRELQWAMRQGQAAAVAAAPVDGAVSRKRMPLGRWIRDPRSLGTFAVAVAGLAVGVAAFLGPMASDPTLDTVSLSITLPASLADVQPARNLDIKNVAISPDDGWVAFGGARKNAEALFIRGLDRFEIQEVPGGGRVPFFRADSAALGFFRGAEVWRTPVDRVAPVRVGTLQAAVWNLRDVLWHPAGDILVATDRGIYRLPENGGEPTLAVAADAARREAFLQLSLLDDGRILASIQDPNGEQLAVVDPRGWTLTRIEGSGGGRFARGWLFRPSPTGAVAVRFDPELLSAGGEPVVIDDTPGSTIPGARTPVVSAGGSMAWVANPITPSQLVWVDRAGRESTLARAPAQPHIRWPRLSPDATRLAFGRVLADAALGQLEVFDLTTGAQAQLSLPNATEPVWLADGTGVVSSSGGRPNQGLVLQSVDGRKATELIKPDFEVWPTSVSRAGDLLLYYVNNGGDQDDDVYVMELETMKSARVGRQNAKGARFSPDGRWIAFQALADGRYQVEVVAWPNPDGRRVVSSQEGGTEPIWSADGRELFYRSGDRVMVAKVLEGTAFATAPPEVLFSFPYFHDPYSDQSWDLAPDGRFLMLKPAPSLPLEVRVIRNVPALLERHVRGTGR